jgi:hypothetical protein
MGRGESNLSIAGFEKLSTSLSLCSFSFSGFRPSKSGLNFSKSGISGLRFSKLGIHEVPPSSFFSSFPLPAILCGEATHIELIKRYYGGRSRHSLGEIQQRLPAPEAMRLDAQKMFPHLQGGWPVVTWVQGGGSSGIRIHL